MQPHDLRTYDALHADNAAEVVVGTGRGLLGDEGLDVRRSLDNLTRAVYGGPSNRCDRSAHTASCPRAAT